MERQHWGRRGIKATEMTKEHSFGNNTLSSHFRGHSFSSFFSPLSPVRVLKVGPFMRIRVVETSARTFRKPLDRFSIIYPIRRSSFLLHLARPRARITVSRSFPFRQYTRMPIPLSIPHTPHNVDLSFQENFILSD